MKKSEVFNLIKDIVHSRADLCINHTEIHEGTIDGISRRASEEILELLDSLEFAPPAVKEPCPTHYIDATGQVQRGEDSFTFVHRWDDEAPVETSNET